MMTGFRLNLSPLKEPLGFVKLVEWVSLVTACWSICFSGGKKDPWIFPPSRPCSSHPPREHQRSPRLKSGVWGLPGVFDKIYIYIYTVVITFRSNVAKLVYVADWVQQHKEQRSFYSCLWCDSFHFKGPCCGKKV